MAINKSIKGENKIWYITIEKSGQRGKSLIKATKMKRRTIEFSLAKRMQLNLK